MTEEELTNLRARAAIYVKYHSRKHYLLAKFKPTISKRALTEEECHKIIEVGKTFAGQEKDPIQHSGGFNRATGVGEYPNSNYKLPGKIYGTEGY